MRRDPVNTMRRRAPLPALGLAAIGVCALCAGLRLENAQRYGLGMTVLFAAACAGCARTLRCEKRMRRFGLAFGFALSACLLLGYRMELVGSVGGGGIGWLLLSAVCFAPMGGALFEAGVRLLSRDRPACAWRTGERGFFWLAFGLVLAGWLPVFLGLYPGVFAYDVLVQLAQGPEIPYSRHHPLVHTLLVSGMYRLGTRLGDATIGIALYAALQMVLLALSMAYALLAIRRAGCPKPFCVAALAAFALLPFHGILAISTTKDTLFSAAALWLTALLTQGVRGVRTGWRHGLLTAAAAALVCLLRSNGVYALALLLAGGLVLRAGRRGLCAVLAGVAISACVSGALDIALHHPDDGRTREALSVPIQQMARVIALNPEWRDDPDVRAVFQGEIDYRPALADPVKSIFRLDCKTPFSQVIRLWLRLFRERPEQYVDAVLELTRGWWDLNDLSHSRVYGDYSGYMQTFVLNGGMGVERRPVLPALGAFYQWLMDDNGYQAVPVLSLLCAPALWVWLLLFACLAALYARRMDVLFPGLLGLGITATALLGPCCIMRYAYPMMLCAPILLGFLRAPEKQNGTGSMQENVPVRR